MEAALRSFARLPVVGRRIAVLGEMRELGSHADGEHARVGALAAEVGIDQLVVVGDGAGPMADAAAAGGVEVERVTDADGALAVVRVHVRSGDAVLVKASRAVGLEHVAHQLVGGPRS
jgi:UDP-N-acetylmuramoyl-tripeptide--D-alanyl-D-alanine ligase